MKSILTNFQRSNVFEKQRRNVFFEANYVNSLFIIFLLKNYYRREHEISIIGDLIYVKESYTENTLWHL